MNGIHRVPCMQQVWSAKHVSPRRRTATAPTQCWGSTRSLGWLPLAQPCTQSPPALGIATDNRDDKPDENCKHICLHTPRTCWPGRADTHQGAGPCPTFTRRPTLPTSGLVFPRMRRSLMAPADKEPSRPPSSRPEMRNAASAPSMPYGFCEKHVWCRTLDVGT